MYNINFNKILYLMAMRELDMRYRACSTFDFPTSQSYLRWTVEEDARQIAHTFDNLANFSFNHYDTPGIIRHHSISSVELSVSEAFNFYVTYQNLLKHNTKLMDLFVHLLYLRAVKLAEIATGIRMDYDWLLSLEKYGEHPSAVKVRQDTPELKSRIKNGEFEPTEEEKAALADIFPDLEKSLNEYLTNIYGVAYVTARFIWHNQPVIYGR